MSDLFDGDEFSIASGRRDPLVQLIKKTCYADSAVYVAELMRKAIRTYRDHDTGDVIGELSERVMSAIPTARRAGTSGGIHPVYVLSTKHHTYKCIWRELLANGSYNHVFYADLFEDDSNKEIPAVVKHTSQSDLDLRVYLLENVIHAMLYAHPETSSLVVPMKFAFKIRMTGFPPYKLATVMNDPGRGDLGGWIEKEMKNDEEMFAVLTQAAWVMHRAQKAASIQHRDLKCDNIMIQDTVDETMEITVNDDVTFLCPTQGIKLLLIDFGMARMEIGGEYIACDCMHDDSPFNPSHDMQNLLCTMYEDYHECFTKRAPRFGKWLSQQVRPLMQTVRKYWANYDTCSSSSRHKKLSYVVYTERIPGFTPLAMLETLGKTYWNRMMAPTHCTRSKTSRTKK